MVISNKYKSSVDAAWLALRIRRDYPEKVEKARSLIISILQEEELELLDIYLGNKDEDSNNLPGLSHERFRIDFAQRDLCRLLRNIEDENLENWTDQALEWYARRLLNLPFKLIGSDNTIRKSTA